MPEDTINAGNYTPITRALREYIERHPTMMHAVGLTDLCDNIDAIHAVLEDANAEMREFCNRLEDAAKKRKDLTLYGVDYTALPLDADGVPIHVGDVVIESLPFGGESKPLVVDRMELGRYDGKDVWAVALDTDKSPWVQPPLLRHHHAPTVEDVLREFGKAWVEWEDGSPYDPIAKYAAKLRLAVGDAE